MARLPTAADIRKVSPVSIPDVRYPVEAFTAESRVMQEAGAEMQRAGRDLIVLADKRAEEDAATEARKADAELQKRFREMRTGTLGDPSVGGTELDAGMLSQAQPGWSSLRGQGLLSSQQEIGAQIDSAYEEILSGLSDRARAKFEFVGLARVNSEQERLSVAGVNARKAWQAETSKARIDELTSTFIETGSQDDKVAAVDEITRSVLRDVVGVSSFDEIQDEQTQKDAQEMVQNAVRRTLTSAHTQRISQLLVDDPNGYEAARYFKQYKDEISPDKRDDISASIKNANFKRDVEVAARDAVAKLGVNGAIGHAKKLADTKGQAFSDAMRARINTVAQEQKAQITAANAATKKAIVDAAFYSGATPRELMTQFPGWSGWKTKAGMAAVTSAYEQRQNIKSGVPLVETDATRAVVNDLRVMSESQLASQDLETLKKTVTKEAFEKWAPKILAAQNAFSWDNKEAHDELISKLTKIAELGKGDNKVGKKLLPGYKPEDKAKPYQRVNNARLIKELAHRLVQSGLQRGTTDDELLEFIVQNQMPLQFEGKGFFGGDQDFADLSAISRPELQKIVEAGDALTIEEDAANAAMSNLNNKQQAINSAINLYNNIAKNYKKAGIPLPSNLEKMPSLNNEQLAEILTWNRIAERLDTPESSLLSAYAAAKAMGATYAPTEDEIEDEKEAAKQIQEEARQKQQEERVQHTRNVIGAALSVYETFSGRRVPLTRVSRPLLERSFEQVPTSFSPEEKNLVDYHRGVLLLGREREENGETTTIRTMGVTNPADGLIYEVPTYVNGKLLSESEAIEYAKKVGWDLFPSWDLSKTQEQYAYENFHDRFAKIKNADLALIRKVK